MRHFHSAIKTLFIAAIFVIASFASDEASAQTSATAAGVAGTATIAQTMTITEVNSLSFGSIIPDAGSASTIILDESDGRSIGTGAPSLVSGGTVTSPSFTVTGDNNATYAFTSPGTVTLTSGGDTMTVDTWTGLSATSGSATLTLDGTGNDTMSLGATLNIGMAQASGVYNGTFSVTIDYN